jgi:adenylate cyclase
LSTGERLDERWWRDNLAGRHRGLRLGRTLFRHLPREPRCKLCAAPFAGAGGLLMRPIGKVPWPRNPKYCASCFHNMERWRGGAEIECSLLFADVRGSTAMAERMRPSEMRALMDRFYTMASRILVDHDAIVDKFVGDEVIGIFVPALAGDRHAARAIAAARAVIAATGAAGDGPRLPVGAGVHSGVAFVGTVGELPKLELTAVGDAVNVTARLASVAGADEVLVTLVAARAAGLGEAGHERRDLELKGKSQPTPVLVLAP